MKMVMICYNAAIDGEVREMLDRLGAREFTKIPHAQGRGKTSEPRFDTEVWPGTNCVLYAAAEEEMAQRIMERVRELRRDLGREGLKAFLLPVEGVS